MVPKERRVIEMFAAFERSTVSASNGLTYRYASAFEASILKIASWRRAKGVPARQFGETKGRFT